MPPNPFAEGYQPLSLHICFVFDLVALLGWFCMLLKQLKHVETAQARFARNAINKLAATTLNTSTSHQSSPKQKQKMLSGIE